MNNISRLVKLKPTNELYSDALQSYKEIYNACMAKGSEQLEHEWLGGNPIQLDTNNMNSMLKNSNSYADYFISTKADGMRFMMFIGNKNEIKDNERTIYFIDSKENFWNIKDLPSIPGNLNLDKILIDGEMIFWGKLTPKMSGNSIDEYEIVSEGTNIPLIGFLTFDILYGPTTPSYESDTKDSVREYYNQQRPDPQEGEYVYKLGSNGGMVGFKSLDRWPTTRRRHVLEELFLNKNSNMYKYLHLESDMTLPHSNFAIFVSPFIKINDMFDGKYSHKIYDEMISILTKSIAEQYFILDETYKPVKMDLPRGKIDTDGLIFTPAIENYLKGPWMLCNNKQYKWKPVGMLTIDFEIGDLIKNNFYHANVRYGNKNSKFLYTMDNVEYASVISIDEDSESVSKGDIYECLYQNIDKKGKYIYFKMIKKRYDKIDPNPYLTAASVLSAADLNDDLLYLKNLTGMKTKPNVLDFIITLKERKYVNKNTILDITSSFGKSKLIKCYVSRHPIMIFEQNRDNLLKLIKQRQEDKTGLLELELRLNLMTPFKIQPAYTNCLVKAFLSSKYTPIPIIKVYKNKESNDNASLRSVYAIIGSDVMLEETVRKTTLSTIHLHTDLYRYNYDLVLSKEIKETTPVSIKSGSVQYQNRYNIMNLSKYWRVDIIEYGSEYSIERAKINYEQNRITRIDIEYDPGHFLKDIKKWTPEIIESNENMKEFLKNTKLGEVTDEILQECINMLNMTDPLVVLKDLGSILIKIFGVLDVDSVNYEKIKERNERNKNTEKEKELVVKSLFERMRNFHNYVKQVLISNAAKKFKNPTLFDISVGRGGDIDKWNKAGINEVYAIDPDRIDIEAAKKRLEFKKYIKGRNYIFEHGEISNPGFKLDEKYNIVSCQFTIHYFFKSDKMLETTVKNISNSLKIGGYFIGTTIVGDNVRQVVEDNKFPEYVKATKVDDNSYTWELLDNNDDIYKKELLEYYMDFEKFVDVCKKYKMELVSYIPFSELYKVYKSHDLNDYELYVSKLNSAFEFIKV